MNNETKDHFWAAALVVTLIYPRSTPHFGVQGAAGVLRPSCRVTA